MLKKIILKPKSGLITPLESDTVLSYVFGFAFSMGKQEVIDVFEDFRSGNLPFLISNGFSIGILNGEKVSLLPKPIYFVKIEKINNDLVEDVKNEPFRKRIKKIRFLPSKLKYFKAVFEGDFYEVAKKELIGNLESGKTNFIVDETTDLVWKNQIPRFNSGETNIYSAQANYTSEYNIFVKIFDEEKFNKFFEFMKNIFETIGFGAGKSRGFGKFEELDLINLSEDEKQVFDYLENLRKNKIVYIMNNFKPTDDEIEIIDIENSFIDMNFKNAKTIQEWNQQFFKGNLNFIKAGSVLVLKEDKNLKGYYHKSNESYNFGYLF